MEEANSQRFILVAKSLWRGECAEILKAEFEGEGYSIVTEMEEGNAVEFHFNAKKSEEVLGMEYIQPE